MSKKVNCNLKGKIFEREIANYLTCVSGSKFLRVPSSGAFGTVNKLTDSRFLGDVFSEDERFHDIVIECKSYKSLSFGDLFNKNSVLYKWIEQSEKESGEKEWVLFFKINRIGTFILEKTDNLCSINYLGIDKSDELHLNDDYIISRLRVE